MIDLYQEYYYFKKPNNFDKNDFKRILEDNDIVSNFDFPHDYIRVGTFLGGNPRGASGTFETYTQYPEGHLITYEEFVRMFDKKEKQTIAVMTDCVPELAEYLKDIAEKRGYHVNKFDVFYQEKMCYIVNHPDIHDMINDCGNNSYCARNCVDVSLSDFLKIINGDMEPPEKEKKITIKGETFTVNDGWFKSTLGSAERVIGKKDIQKLKQWINSGPNVTTKEKATVESFSIGCQTFTKDEFNAFIKEYEEIAGELD